MKRKGIVMICVVFLMFITSMTMNYAQTWEYSIDKMMLTDMSGRVIDDYTGGSCMIEVSYTRNVYDEQGYIIITGYSEQGKLISFNYMKTSEQKGHFATLVTPAEDENLGRVKVYVWDSLRNMNSMAEVKQLVLDPDTPDLLPERGKEITFDGSLIRGLICDSYGGGLLKIKKGADTLNTTNYKLAPDTSLYVNGLMYCEIERNEAEAADLIKNSIGECVLLEDGDKLGWYDKILIDVYATATVSQIIKKSEYTEIFFTDIVFPGYVYLVGNSVKIFNADIDDGCRIITVTRNGKKASLLDIEKGDVVSLQYDIRNRISDSAFFNIIANDGTAEGELTFYDYAKGTYYINNQEYQSSGKELDMEVGCGYICELDSFGRIHSFKRDINSINAAIIESYNVDNVTGNASISLYDFKKGATVIALEPNYKETVINRLVNMGISTNKEETAQNCPLERRIVEYDIKNSNGRIVGIEFFETSRYSEAEYIGNAGYLGKLINDAVIIDASGYTNDIGWIEKEDISMLKSGWIYDVICVCVNDIVSADFVIIISETEGQAVGGSLDVGIMSGYAFGIIAEKSASYALVDGERVRTASVFVGEDIKRLYLPDYVKIYSGDKQGEISDLMSGNAIFYKENSQGITEEIYVLYSNFQSVYNCIRRDMSEFVKLPLAYSEINADEWGVTLKPNDISGQNKIQLLFAPVCCATEGGVCVAPIEYDGKWYFINTNKMFTYGINEKSEIYSFDVSGNTVGISRFSKGEFIGIALEDTDKGHAWFERYDNDSFDFTNAVQFAFMIVVNGNVKYALVHNN